MRFAIPVLLACIAAAPIARAEAPVRFTDTEAAKAFQAGAYEKALEELLRLRETNPDNLLVLRYLAMSYDRMGRYTDALRIYLDALKRAPENAALLYHSGETLYNLLYADDARRHFQRVVTLAPGTEYAAYSRDYLDALDQQRVSRQAPGAPRRFSVYAEVSFLHDDYDLPDEFSRTERISEYLSAEVNLVRTPRMLVSIDFSGYGAQYLDDRDENQDIWQATAGATVQHRGQWGRVPAVSTLKAYHQEVWFDDGPDYSESDIGSLGLQLGLTSNTITRVYYRFTDDRFEDDGFDPAFASRDGENHAGGVQETLYFLQRNAWLTLGASFEENRAEGDNYDYDGPTYSALLSLPLPYAFRLDLGYEYAEEVYRNFAAPVRRETERHEWSGSVYRWIGRSVLVRLRYAEIEEDSTYPELAYDRRGIGMSVAYVY